MCLRPVQTSNLSTRTFTTSRSIRLPIRNKNESLTELKLLMRVKDIDEHGGSDSKVLKQAVYDKLLSIIKDRTCFPSLTRIELPRLRMDRIVRGVD